MREGQATPMSGSLTPELKINLRFAPDVGYRSWLAEAEPIEVNSGGRIYRLTGFSPWGTIVPGDVVRAELGHDSFLWATELVELAPRAASMFGIMAPSLDTSLKQLAKAGQRLKHRHGCESFISSPVLLSSWPCHLTEEDILSKIHGVHQNVMNAVDMETDERHEFVRDQLMLDRVWLEMGAEEPTTSDYWAAEDPAWAELGADSPELLAYIQTLASEDRRVLATIRGGFHINVLHYIQRLNAEDPSSLPPLDGPLLLDPDGY